MRRLPERQDQWKGIVGRWRTRSWWRVGERRMSRRDDLITHAFICAYLAVNHRAAGSRLNYPTFALFSPKDILRPPALAITRTTRRGSLLRIYLSMFVCLCCIIHTYVHCMRMCFSAFVRTDACSPICSGTWKIERQRSGDVASAVANIVPFLSSPSANRVSNRRLSAYVLKHGSTDVFISKEIS